MNRTAEELILHIADAFKDRSLPAGAAIFMSESPEVDTQELERVAREMKWVDIPHGVLCRNSLAPVFFTAEAFAWFLPPYMVISITLYHDTDTLTTTLITCLTPQDAADAEHFKELVEEMRRLGADVEEEPAGALAPDAELEKIFTERVNLLTAKEKSAVREYLEYMDAEHGGDLPAFGPRQALERYWAGVEPL